MTEAEASRARRTYGLVVVAGLAAAGLVALAARRPWYTADAEARALPPVRVTVDGTDLYPLAGAIGLVLLGAFGAVLATRGLTRRLVGVMIVVGSVIVAVCVFRSGEAQAALTDELAARAVVGVLADPQTQWWRWLTLLGATGSMLAGAAVAARGHRWPSMGDRYEAPSRTGPDDARRERHGAGQVEDEEPSLATERLWQEIDRGHDPTRDS